VVPERGVENVPVAVGDGCVALVDKGGEAFGMEMRRMRRGMMKWMVEKKMVRRKTMMRRKTTM
jgi:hypothetical protein